MRLGKHDKASRKFVVTTDRPPAIDAQDYIEKCAYFKAEARGFAPGHELDDWLAAEAEIGPSRKTH